MERDEPSPWARLVETELRYAVADHGMSALSQVIEMILDISRDYKFDLNELQPAAFYAVESALYSKHPAATDLN